MTGRHTVSERATIPIMPSHGWSPGAWVQPGAQRMWGGEPIWGILSHHLLFSGRMKEIWEKAFSLNWTTIKPQIKCLYKNGRDRSASLWLVSPIRLLVWRPLNHRNEHRLVGCQGRRGVKSFQQCPRAVYPGMPYNLLAYGMSMKALALFLLLFM